MLENIARKVLEEDLVLYRWCGKLFSAEDYFTRLDKTYLYVIWPSRGQVYLSRILGYSENRLSRNPKIVFTTGDVQRITSGPRKGFLIPPHKVHGGEDTQTAGVKKYLELGHSPRYLNPEHVSDKLILSMLEEVTPGAWSVGDTLEHPDFYISSSRDLPEVRLRVNKEGRIGNRNISHLPHREQSRAIMEELSLPAGKGRNVVPFDKVYGKGVLVASPQMAGKWRCCRKEAANFNKGYLEVSIC